MPYTVYKVTNLVTQDFYIGVHRTDNPMDDYLGSGKAIREQVAHYGPENFQKDILASFDKRREAYRLEAEMVEPLLGTPGCLNIHPGGHGGFGHINAKGLNNRVGNHQKARRALAVRIATDATLREAMRLRMDHNRTLRDPERLKFYASRAAQIWRGQRHKPETLQTMSERKRGEHNPAFGTKLIHHPGTGEHRRVPPEQLPDLLARGWAVGWSSVQRDHMAVVAHRLVFHTVRQRGCALCGNGKRQLRSDGLCAGCWRARQVEEARQLLTEGVSHSEAARLTGLNRTALYKYLKS